MLIDAGEWRPDILEEHVEELGFLWNRRLRSARSPNLTGAALLRLDARIEAHADALSLAGTQALPLLVPTLTGDATAPALGAAQVLARADAEDADAHLLEALHVAPPPAREGLRRALSFRIGGRLMALCERLSADQRASGGPAPAVAATAAAITAAHGRPAPAAQLQAWLTGEDPLVRRLAWIAVGHGAAQVREDAFRTGLRDLDADVRRAALLAAARTGQPWLLPHLRGVAARPSADAIEEHLVLAILARPEDAPLVLALAEAPALGWGRFQVASAWGRAEAIESLLRAMGRPGADPVEIALAGAAFRQITGLDVEAPGRVPLVAPDAPPETAELADEVRACDVGKAGQAWQQVASHFRGKGRFARGLPVDDLAPGAWPPDLDLEARFGAQLRAAHAGARGLALDDEAFPATGG